MQEYSQTQKSGKGPKESEKKREKARVEESHAVSREFGGVRTGNEGQDYTYFPSKLCKEASAL